MIDPEFLQSGGQRVHQSVWGQLQVGIYLKPLLDPCWVSPSSISQWSLLSCPTTGQRVKPEGLGFSLWLRMDFLQVFHFKILTLALFSWGNCLPPTDLLPRLWDHVELSQTASMLRKCNTLYVSMDETLIFSVIVVIFTIYHCCKKDGGAECTTQALKHGVSLPSKQPHSSTGQV